MNKQDKAFCGDGLAKLIIGELLPKSIHGKNYNIYNQYLSNTCMAQAYCIMSGVLYDHKTHCDHTLGTEYECILYEIYKDHGYEKAKEFFIKTLVEKVKSKEISFL